MTIRDGRVGRPCHPVEDRFWGKVERRGPNECWLWLGATTNGYGTFRVGGGNVIASRFAYELTYGKLPSRKIVVRHSCDNPPCCNPAHLVRGSHLDNERDKVARGRDRKAVGTAVATAKLTESDVLEIRRLFRPYKTTIPQLAKFYGVHQATIGGIVYRYTWKHL